MNRFNHLWVLALALIASGGLAYKFVPNFEPIKMAILAVVILIGSEVLYHIDKNIGIRTKR